MNCPLKYSINTLQKHHEDSATTKIFKPGIDEMGDLADSTLLFIAQQTFAARMDCFATENVFS